MSLLLIAILTIGMTLATGCSKKSDPADALVVTVGDQKIYLQDMMYYIYTVEATGDYYNQLYQQYGGSSYWDMEYSEGVTMREQMKQYVMDTTIMYEILYEKAVEKGYKITDEETTANQNSAKDVIDKMSDDQKKLTGFTEDNIVETLRKITISEKYYKELIDSFDIDDAAITDTIKFDDYRQYNTEYLYVPTVGYDSSNQKTELSDEEKATAKDAITAALKKVKAGEAFSDIIKDDTTIQNSTINFVYGDTNAETAYQDAAIKLENDAYTTDIVETESGYFIVKMVDNKATESYDKAVSDAISKAEQEAFTAEYDKIKKDYTTTVNTKVWDNVVIGETTLVKSENTTDTSTTNSGTTNTTDTNTTDTNTTSK